MPIAPPQERPIKNRGSETPRQYELLLGDMVIEEWDALQDPAGLASP